MFLVWSGNKLKGNYVGGNYDGEKIPGDLDQWNVLSGDSNYVLQSTYGQLSRRSMTLYHTYGPARAAINKQVEYAVGPGLVFRSQPDWNMLGITRERAKDWGKEFQKIVNYYMQEMNFYEKQSVIMRGGLAGGDSLLFFIRDADGLQDMIEFPGNEIDWAYNDANHTLGVRHDKYFRRTGFRKDSDDVMYRDTAGNQNAIQYFEKELPRQLRGYPLVYSIINLAKNDDRHTDAITQRAVMESILVGTSKTETTNIPAQAASMAKANSKKFQQTTAKQPLLQKIANSVKLGAGNMFQLKEGEEMSFTDMKTPSNNFKDFKEYILEYIGAATGTPSQMITSKYNTSYTSHKGTFNDFKKSYMKKRATFERNVNNIVVREIAKDAILRGFIEAPGFFDNPMLQRAYLQGMYLGPIPGAINPVQEVTSEIKAVDNAFQLRSDVALRYGNEYDDFIEERYQEELEFYNSSPEKQAEAIAAQEAANATSNAE